MPARRAIPITVLVVDDHRTFAEALGVALGLERDLTVHVASSGHDAIEEAEHAPPDVVLIDMEMPGMGGVETTRRITEMAPEVRLIAVSAHDDDLVKARAVEAGAAGYISKLAPLDEVADAVRTVHRGDSLLDRFELRRLQRRLKHQRHQDSTERQRANRLTPRQREILQLMADGVPGPDMATRLGVSPATLRTHVQNILMKLGVHSKTEALALAIRHGKVSVRV
jgi:DNA-binding NarL/FixJ family response regulator